MTKQKFAFLSQLSIGMVLALIASLAIWFSGGAGPVKIPIQPSGTANAQGSFDEDAERRLLELANQARAQAGLAPLEADNGLRNAARTHAQVMAAQQQLSHQFAGESALPVRLAKNSDLHLNRAGENVAYAGAVDQAQDTLMHSPPHRENLLNPGYNVAGFGVVRSGNTLYITQDFGYKLPTLPAQEVEASVVKQVNQARQENGLSLLRQVNAGTRACPDSDAALVKTSSTPARYILRYTSLDPSELPAGTEKVIRDTSLQTVSVAACYARNSAYPNGAYWVVAQFF